jgi:hypothetical protein
VELRMTKGYQQKKKNSGHNLFMGYSTEESPISERMIMKLSW